jgi:hypothetical protein
VLTFVAWVILGLGVIQVGLPFGTLLPLFIVMMAVNIVYVGTLAAAVATAARASILSNLGLLLATYPYAALISLANFAAMILILRKGARLWLKTEKTGYVDKPLQLGSS